MSQSTLQPTEQAVTFISYAREDEQFVKTMREALKSHQVEPVGDWLLTPGQKYEQRLKELNLMSQAFVFVISPDSIKSEACMNELTMAVENKKQILPVSHRDHGEDKKLDSALRAPHWTLLRKGDDFETGIKGLVKAVNTDFELMQTHGRLLLAAENWNNNGRNRSYLLRKDGLKEAERWLAQTSAQPGKLPQPTPLQIEFIFSGRRARGRAARIAFGVVLAIAVSLTALTIYAFAQRTQAKTQANIATENAKRATDNEAKAVSNAEEAQRQRLAADANAALAVKRQKEAEVNLAEAKRQRAIAMANEEKAIRNAAEARRQQLAAEENARRAVEVGKRRLVVATLLLNPEGTKLDSVYSLNRDLVFGLRPWSLRDGDLNDILRKFQARQPEAFVRIFGDGNAAMAQRLLDYVATPAKDAVPLDDILIGPNSKPAAEEPADEEPVTDEEDELYDEEALKNSRKHSDHNLPEGNLNREPWLSRFKQAGQEPAFQAIQLDEHTERYLGFMKEMQVIAPEIKSERGVAFILDLYLYRGPARAKKLLLKAKESASGKSERELLLKIIDLSVGSAGNAIITSWTRRRHQMFLTSPFFSDKVLGF
jgi:flagellar biosynthesis GTPase FlhF